MPEYRSLEESIDYVFADRSLLRQALTHPSYTAERKSVDYDNQRLEFLGDAVLQLCASDLLFKAYSTACEGKLSSMRSLLAREASLAGIARNLGLGSFIRLGHGEIKNGGQDRDSTLADAMEAVFGAIYLDGGFAAAHKAVHKLCRAAIEDIEHAVTEGNPKGSLQEVSQEHFKALPFYETIEVSGPEHEPEYTVKVSLLERELAIGSARNRREAEKEAARLALRKLKQEKEIEPEK